MTHKRTSLYFSIFLLSVLIPLVAVVVVYLVLPAYLETKIIPNLAREAGLPRMALQIRKVGLTGADLAEVRLGGDQEPGISVDSIRIDYHLKDLIKGRVARITVSGLSIDVDYQAETLNVGGFSLLPRAGEASDTAVADPPVAVSVGSISVLNSVLTCRWAGRVFRLPFEVTVIPDAALTGFERFLLRVSPREQSIRIAGSRSRSGDRARISWSGIISILRDFLIFWRWCPGCVWGAAPV